MNFTTFQEKYLNTKKLIISFFVFLTIFPTLRVTLIGTQGSTNLYEFIISVLPELFFMVIAISIFVKAIIVKQSIRFNLIDYSVLAFFLVNVILGSISSADFKLIIYGFRMTYLPVLLYFVIRLINLKYTESDLVLNAIFNWFTLIGVLGIVLYFFFREQMTAMLFKMDSKGLQEYFVLRMTSVLWSPVAFGSLMSITSVYWFSKIGLGKGLRNNIKFSIVVFCLIFSVSRGAMLAAGVGIVALIFIYFKRNKVYIGWLFVWLLFIYILCSLYIADPFTLTKWLLISTRDTATFEGDVTRVKFWSSSLELFKSKPFGLGLGRAGHVAARFFSPDSSEAAYYSTDGWFLKLLCENGIQGLVVYILFSISFLYLSVLHFIKGIKLGEGSFFYFTLVFFICINIQNIVSNVLDFFLVNYFFWMIIGFFSNSFVLHKDTP